MKLRLLLIPALLVPLVASADCNLPLATAAGQYLAALEKANLQRYQNPSACEVLSYEFWRCTDTQIAKLQKSFAPKEVLGHYCGPHIAPPPPGEDAKSFSKGAQVFSWKEENGYTWFALMPGTNRLRIAEELKQRRRSEGEFLARLAILPADTEISWNSPEPDWGTSERYPLALPDRDVLSRVKRVAAKHQLKIDLR